MHLELEEYILNHTESESQILRELNRQTHLKMLMPRMLSGHLQGQILKMFTHMIAPTCVLEIGTYTGYSAICIAEAMSSNSILHTIEVNDELQEFIQYYFMRSKCSERIKLHIGDALEIIPTLPYTFDMVFIDAHKKEYLNYYHLVFDKVRQGGFIIADNVLWDGKVVSNDSSLDTYTVGIKEFNDFVHNDKRVENVILPIRDGLMVVRKK